MGVNNKIKMHKIYKRNQLHITYNVVIICALFSVVVKLQLLLMLLWFVAYMWRKSLISTG